MEKKEIREAMLAMEGARKRLLHPYFQKLGLTPGQPRILNKLYEQDGITQKKLADRCGMDVATVSRSLDKLEEAGWLVRQRGSGLQEILSHRADGDRQAEGGRGA